MTKLLHFTSFVHYSFNVLLVSLNNGSNLEKLAGFMDNLALLLHRVQSINSLTSIFQEYEQGTGAKLNYNKCFILSTEKFSPVGPWAEIPLANYLERRLCTWELQFLEE